MPPKKRDLAAEKAAKQKKVLYILIPGFLAVVWFMLIPTLTKKPPTPPVVPTGGTTPVSGGTNTTTGVSSPYVYAVLSVNGLAEGVALNAPFPAASPLFSLVAIGSRWAQFSLVTGTFANGANRVTL